MALVIPHENKIQENNKECRICFELDSIDNLIWPCNCKGSVKYVHERCLITWIETTRNQQYKKKCPMCNMPYFIRYYNKRENIKITLTLGIQHMALEIILIEICIAVITCSISAIDSATNAYSTRIISLDLYKTNNLDYTVKNLFAVSYNSSYINFGKVMAVFYYYNYAHYFSYLLVFVCFFFYIFFNLKNKNIYFKFLKFKLILFFFYYNIFFFLFNVYMWHDSFNATLFFNIFMTIVSFLNFVMFKVFILLHNETIKKINSEYFRMEILNVEPNPLLMI